uniref:U3 small nucleolar RNA-associated protein 15 homolog n=1 Tax=Laticauda laticaudata TaxID=8630 RepID=A0A8C5RHD1_LATLA
MANYKPVIVQTFPKLGEKITKDTLYWKNYKTPIQIKEFGAVNKIDFSPVPPYNYAVTASSRIHIYGRYSQEPVKTFSRFKDVAYCATYREDGQLLVAGSEEGSVRIFDIGGRAPLRQFEGHSKAVHVVGFLSDKYRIMSGADDYTTRVWDVSTSSEIACYKEHTDYVRCGCTSKLNADLFVTGSYDHTVKVYDTRTDKSIMKIEHGQPVESVNLFPSEGLLVTAGGRYIKIWDILKGGQLLVSLRNHHKTVTSLCLSSSGQRLLSGSLDRHVKIYSTTSYKVVHSFNYEASILSLALASFVSVYCSRPVVANLFGLLCQKLCVRLHARTHVPACQKLCVRLHARTHVPADRKAMVCPPMPPTHACVIPTHPPLLPSYLDCTSQLIFGQFEAFFGLPKA